MSTNETEYSFGARLVQLRQNAGLSQQALADRLSVTRQAVSNWERGQTCPDFDTLRSIAQILGADLNAFGDGAPPSPKRRTGRRLLAGALVVVLCGVSFLGGYWTKRQLVLGGEGENEPVQAERRVPHTIRTITPNGAVLVVFADGREEAAQLLAALPDTGPGPVERTAELVDTFCYFAENYAMQFTPDYADGSFSSWDQVLFWLYKGGISRGGVMTREQVDAALEERFGAGVRYEHQSTEHFPLTEEGYTPVGVTSCGVTYTLRSLDRLEDGAYEAVLAVKSGPTITFTLDGDTFQFRTITRSDASI